LIYRCYARFGGRFRWPGRSFSLLSGRQGARRWHGDDEQGPLFRPIRNNRTGRIDKALVAEGRHRGAVRHVEKTRGLPPPELARPGLQELGRIKRTLFMLDWLESPELRRRCHAGLSKSEQRHFLAQVICTFKQGRQTRPALPTAVPRRSSFVPARWGDGLCSGNPSAARRYARSGEVARHPIRGCLPPFHLGFFRLIGIARSVVSTPLPAPFCPPLCLPLRAVPR
jgi:hypothetical protein